MIYDRPKKLDTVSITPPLFYCYGISEIKMSESQRFRVIFVYQLSPNGPARSGWSSMLIRIFVMNHYFFFIDKRPSRALSACTPRVCDRNSTPSPVLILRLFIVEKPCAESPSRCTRFLIRYFRNGCLGSVDGYVIRVD
jgi:hypothetical protein